MPSPASFFANLYTLFTSWFVPKDKHCSHCDQPYFPPHAEIAEEQYASIQIGKETGDIPKVPIDHQLCQKHAKLLSGIKASIMFEGRNIGTAYNLSASPNNDGSTSLFATSLVFRYDELDRLFLNGVVDHAGQKDAFDLHLTEDDLPNEQYLKACLTRGVSFEEVYLTGGQKPILTTYRGEEQAWVNQAEMETMHPISE